MEKQKIPKKWLFIIFVMISTLGLAQQTITVRPRPNLSAGPDQILAPGQTEVQIQATSDDPGPGQTYLYGWLGPNGFISSLLRPSVSDLGTYEITATNSFGCSSSDQMELREANPTDTLFINLPPLCRGEDPIWLFHYTTLMEGSFSGPGVYGYYFHQDSVQAGTHELVWNIDNKVRIAYATVLAGPNVWVHQPMLFGCVDQNVTLSAVGQADSYAWSLLGSTDVLSTNQYYSVMVQSNPTEYLLTAGKYYQLENKTCYLKDTATVSQIPTSFTYTQETGEGANGQIFGSSVSFTPDFQYAQSYSWNFGNIYVPGGGTAAVMSPTYNYNPYYGYFTVTLTMTSVCGVTSDSKVVRVNYLTTSAETLESVDVSVYPNPVSDFLKIRFADKQISSLIIVDMVGRALKQETFENHVGDEYQVDVSSYKPGFYIIRLSGKHGGFVTSKFIKQ